MSKNVKKKMQIHIWVSLQNSPCIGSWLWFVFTIVSSLFYINIHPRHLWYTIQIKLTTIMFHNQNQTHIQSCNNKLLPHTGKCGYNKVNFIWNPHKRYPIDCPQVQNMAGLLRVYILPQSLLRHIQYHVILQGLTLSIWFTCPSRMWF